MCLRGYMHACLPAGLLRQLPRLPHVLVSLLPLALAALASMVKGPVQWSKAQCLPPSCADALALVDGQELEVKQQVAVEVPAGHTSTQAAHFLLSLRQVAVSAMGSPLHKPVCPVINVHVLCMRPTPTHLPTHTAAQIYPQPRTAVCHCRVQSPEHAGHPALLVEGPCGTWHGFGQSRGGGARQGTVRGR